MPASDETWAEIQRAYTTTRETQAALALRTGVAVSTIRRRAEAKGWTRPDPAPSRASERQLPRGNEVRPASSSLVERATRIARMNLDLLEQYMESGNIDVGSPEHERVTRVIGGVTGALTKLGDLGANEQARGDGPGARSAADIERRRHEIAERLERVLARRKAPGDPVGDPD